MKTPESDLHLAALAAAAMPHTEFTGTCSPRYRDDDIAMCGVLDNNDNQFLVVSALNETASLALTSNDALCRTLHRQFVDNVLPFDVPVIQGSSRMRQGGRAVIYNGFDADLLATLFSDDQWPHRDWVDGLATAVGYLHNVPLGTIASAKLPHYSTDEIRKRLLDSLDEAVDTGKVPSVLAGRWEEKIEDVSLWHFTPTLIHTNLSPGSVFGRDGVVEAIIDWGDAYIGDPAEDIATIIPSVSPRIRERFFKAYRQVRRSAVDVGLEERSDFMAEFALLRWLMYGVRKNDDAVVEDAVSMLDELADTVSLAEEAAQEASEQVARRAAASAAREKETKDQPSADHVDQPETVALDVDADIATSEEDISTEALDMHR